MPARHKTTVTYMSVAEGREDKTMRPVGEIVLKNKNKSEMGEWIVGETTRPIIKPKQTSTCGRSIRNENMSNTNTILI